MSAGRPCHCDRYRPGEPFVRGRDCGRCWLWHERPDSPTVRAWKGEPVAPGPPAVPAAAAVEPPPCRLRGRELTGPERAARGLDHGRRWALCLHPEQPLGEAVCPCMGCGPGCRGYRPDRQD